MISTAYITQWRKFAPWLDGLQIEQDLILSRIIVEIFSNEFLATELAFRGGTALHKLFFNPSARYSEDIDLVRTRNGSIKKIIDALRARLEPWLGEPKIRKNESNFTLYYFFNPENYPNTKMRIKIEINVRETFSVYDYLMKPYSVHSNWFTGTALVKTFQLEELLSTKLRALYQRKKGRDLFDLWLGLKTKNLDIQKIIHALQIYLKKQDRIITKKLFGKNLQDKLEEYIFNEDIDRLISPLWKKEHSFAEKWSIHNAAEMLKNNILIHLK